MINKLAPTVASSLDGINDGSTILIGGFGAVGQPDALIEGLIDRGAKDLTIVANNAGHGTLGLARLLRENRVKKIICSFPRIAGSTIFETLYKSGNIALELVPQGTLAERIRAAGAGIPAFYTPTSVGTLLAAGKEVRSLNGRDYVLETALHADVALLQCWEADRLGNLTYRKAGRNFNPIMAMAAGLTIAQTCNICEVGMLDPEKIVTPSIFVDRIVHCPA